MPENDRSRLKKRLQQYSYMITAFDRVNNRDLNHTEKWGLGSVLGYLTSLIDGFGPYDRTGEFKTGGDGAPEPPKKLEEKDLILLTQVYSQTRIAVERLNKRIEQQFAAAPNSSAGKRLKSRLKTEYQQNAKLYSILTKDYAAAEKALMNTREKGKEYTIAEIFDLSRVKSGYTVRHDSIRSTASGNLSERIPLTLTYTERGHKKEQQGYFTRDVKTKRVKPSVSEATKVLNKYKSLDFIDEDYITSLLSHLRQHDKDFYTDIQQRPGKVIFGNWITGTNKMAAVPLPQHHGNLLDKIDSSEKFNMLVDVLHNYLKINNVFSIHQAVKINDEGRINRRNSAMTQVADYLGRPDLLARSENVKLNLYGETVRGTFMKNARGHDVKDKSAESPFLKTTAYSLDSLSLKKQIADLQVIDYLCGNPDRHGGNVFYQFEKQEDGTTKMVGIQGIDNDLSFGNIDMKSRHMSAVLIKDMAVITEDMAVRIQDLNGDKLRELLYGYELTEKEMNAAVTRLRTLQDAIVRHSEEYAKGYGECQLIPGKIKIVHDHELDLIPFEELCVEDDDKNRNLFRKVYSNVSNGRANIDRTEARLLGDYNEAAYDFLMGDYADMKDLTAKLTADKVWHQDATNNYNVMTRRMTDLMERMAQITGPAKTADNQIEPDFQEMVQEMRGLRQVVDQYIAYKLRKNESWRKAKDVDDPKHKQSLTERRYHHAMDCRKLLDKKISQFEKMEEALEKYRDFRPKMSGLKRAWRSNKDKQEQAYIDSDKRHEVRRTKVDSHLKRLERIFTDRLDEIRTEDDPEEKEYMQTQWAVEYGFGINSIEDQEKREEMKRYLKNHEPTLQLEDDTTALKRALAVYMMQNKTNPRSQDPWADANELMQQDYYGAFFNSVKDELINESGKISRNIVVPAYQEIQDYITKLDGFKSLAQLQGGQPGQQGGSEVDSRDADLGSNGSGPVSEDVKEEPKKAGDPKKSQKKEDDKEDPKKEDAKEEPKKKAGSASKGVRNESVSFEKGSVISVNKSEKIVSDKKKPVKGVVKK